MDVREHELTHSGVVALRGEPIAGGTALIDTTRKQCNCHALSCVGQYFDGSTETDEGEIPGVFIGCKNSDGRWGVRLIAAIA